MRSLDFSRYALTSCVAAAMLAACGGSRPPIGAPTQASARVVQQRAAVPACSGNRIGQVQCQVSVEIATRSDKPTGWTPHDLQQAYELPSSTKGSGQIVAVVDAYDNPDVASDLAEYRSTFKLPAANFTKYNQEGQQSNYPEGSPEWGIETDLDVEMVSASCPNCTIYLVEANSSEWSDIETAEAEAVTLGAHIVSNSYTGTGADKAYFDTRAVTYLGSADGGEGVAEPADFDSVVAVGGTVLSKGGGGSRGWTEYASPDDPGGCMKAIRKPPWQHDQYCKHRLANDTAAVANSVAEYDSYDGGGWITVDGLAIPTPLLAGVFGLAGNATEQDGGRTFWQPKHRKHLYPVGGSECTYSMGNYNTCTGWGTSHGIGAF
jgi:subtilase family serine protease